MNNHIPIRLGPLALLLTVISICMTILSLLTFSTAGADLRIAEKYGETVQTTYELEQQGQQFLQQADEALKQGIKLSALVGTQQDKNGIVWKTIQQGQNALKIGLKEENGSYTVVCWKQTKDWIQDNGIGGLWTGN